MNYPKYIIWWYHGRHQISLHTAQHFVEHTNRRAWKLDIIRLKKSKIVSDLKYSELKQ